MTRYCPACRQLKAEEAFRPIDNPNHSPTYYEEFGIRRATWCLNCESAYRAQQSRRNNADLPATGIKRDQQARKMMETRKQ